jgi:hypothetical protein
VPLRPSLVAVIVTLPAASPEIAPAFVILATAGFEDAQETDLPDNTAPVELFVVAVATVEEPTDIEAAASPTSTVATGMGTTVTLAEPVRPSLVADTVALPSATAVTNPSAETVATAGFDVVQLTVLPDRTAPLALLNSADAVAVPPGNSCAEESDTVTVATGAGGGGVGGAVDPPSPPAHAVKAKTAAAKARLLLASLTVIILGMRFPPKVVWPDVFFRPYLALQDSAIYRSIYLPPS